MELARRATEHGARDVWAAWWWAMPTLRLGDPLEQVHAEEAGVGAENIAGDSQR